MWSELILRMLWSICIHLGIYHIDTQTWDLWLWNKTKPFPPQKYILDPVWMHVDLDSSEPSGPLKTCNLLVLMSQMGPGKGTRVHFKCILSDQLFKTLLPRSLLNVGKLQLQLNRRKQTFVFSHSERKRVVAAVRCFGSGTDFKTLSELFGRGKSTVMGALSCYLHNAKLTNWSFNVAREPFEFTLHCTLAFLTTSQWGRSDQIPEAFSVNLDAFTPVFRRNKTMSNAVASRGKLGHFSIIYPTVIFPIVPFAIIHLTNESKPSHVKCFDTKSPKHTF